MTGKQQLELQLALLQDKHDKLSGYIEAEERKRDRLAAIKDELRETEMKLALTMAMQALRGARASNEMSALQIASAKRKITETLEKVA